MPAFWTTSSPLFEADRRWGCTCRVFPWSASVSNSYLREPASWDPGLVTGLRITASTRPSPGQIRLSLGYATGVEGRGWVYFGLQRASQRPRSRPPP